MPDKKEQITYFDRYGKKRLTLGEAKLYTRPSTWREFAFTYDTNFGKVSNLRPGTEKYTLEAVFASSDLGERDRVIDVFLEDAIAGSPGTIEIRGWRLSCFVTAGKPTMVGRMETEISFDVVPATEAIWTREKVYEFRGSGDDTAAEDLWRDYGMTAAGAARGYDYGYSVAVRNTTEVNLSGSGNGYILDVYGPVTNPTLYINDQPVTVYASARAGERIRITANGNDKRIELVSLSGRATSIFNARDKEHSPFIAIDGTAVISYGAVKFDFTAIERKVLPSWS